MHKFRDADKREWELRLTAWQVTKVREATGVELWIKLGKDKSWDLTALDLWLDPAAFIGVVWALIEEQAGTKNVTRESFERSYTPEVYHAVRIAFGDEVLSFSPMPAEVRKTLTEWIRDYGGETTNRPGDSTLNGSAISSPVPSALTPDLTTIAS